MERRRAGRTLGLAMALAPLTAFAQPSDAGSADNSVVQEVVVTAQRRAESAQKVPIAVTALSSDALEAAHVKEVSELTFLAPSLNVVSAQGLVKPFLRGIGTQGAIAGIEMPVAIYQDGVYIATAPAPMFGFNDIERVEVVKGPQGTLFGRNATGGLITITSRDPGDGRELSATATLGRYETREADLFIGGGVLDGVRASLYGRYGDRRKGFGTNLPTGSGTYTIDHDVNLRGKLLFDLAEGSKIKLVGDYVDRDSKMNSTQFFGERSLLNAARLPSAWDTNNGVEPVNHFRGGGGHAEVRQEVGAFELASLTAYRKSTFDYGLDTDMSPLPVLSATPVQKDRQFSQELQVQPVSTGDFRWILGLFYFDATADLDHFTRFGGPLAPLPTSNVTRDIVSSSTTRSYAAYGQFDLTLASRTTLTGGLRFTHERRGFDGVISFVRKDGTSTAAEFAPADLKYDKLTWRVAINQEFAPNVRGYASYNRGFKSGGFNPTQPFDPAYRPEEVDAYEVGFKSELADGRARWNGAAFYYDYRNMQVSTFQNGTTGIFNGASARLRGVESSLTFVLDRHFSITGDIAHLDAEFTSFPTGVRAVRNANGGYAQLVNQDLSGNKTPNAPDLTASINAEFKFESGLGGWAFNASYYYNDGYFTEADNLLRQPAYSLINLSARWTSTDEHYFAQVWAKNVLGEKVTTQLNVTPLGAIVGYQAPATLGVTVGANF